MTDAYVFSLHNAIVWEAIESNSDLDLFSMTKLRDEVGVRDLSETFTFPPRATELLKLPYITEQNYFDIGSYLYRLNHIQNIQLSEKLRTLLSARGYDEALLDMLSSTTAKKLISENVGLEVTEDGTQIAELLDLPYEVAIDILVESGILGNFTPSIHQMSLYAMMPLIREALGFSEQAWQDGKEEMLLALLEDEDSPLSLLQIVLMSKMGASLEDLEGLDYDTVDAIILAFPASWSDFAYKYQPGAYEIGQSYEGQADYLNKLVSETGVLTFSLLEQGLPIEQIAPHHKLDVNEIQAKIANLSFWQEAFAVREIIRMRQNEQGSQ